MSESEQSIFRKVNHGRLTVAAIRGREVLARRAEVDIPRECLSLEKPKTIEETLRIYESVGEKVSD